MTILKKAAVSAAALLAAVLALGYLTAWRSLDSCAADAYSDMRSRGISGSDMRGRKVVLSRNEVFAKVTGPFQVEVSYMVPHDLHGSLHIRRYLVMPWRRYFRSSDVFYLSDHRATRQDRENSGPSGISTVASANIGNGGRHNRGEAASRPG